MTSNANSLDFNPLSNSFCVLPWPWNTEVAKSERYAAGRTLVRAGCIPPARDRRSLSQAQCVRVERGKAAGTHTRSLC